MNKNLYHPNDKTFKDGENLVYIADLPAHLAHTDVPKNVACKELFKLVQRTGNELVFKSGVYYRRCPCSQVQPAHHLPLYHNKITNYTFCIELTTTKRAYIGIKYTGNPQDAPSINPSNTFRWTSDSPSNVWPYANEWMPNDIQYWNSADTLMKLRTNDNDISNYIIKQLVFVRDNHLLDI